jgi:hypothetical protein
VRVFLCALYLVPILAFGQGLTENAPKTSKIEYYLNLYCKADSNQPFIKGVLRFVEKLDEKRASFSGDKDFLEYLFRKTHQRFLKNYVEYVSFSDMLESSTYNCLTGTALYALLLDHFEIRYNVIETNYHIFMLVHTDEGKILLEATDPVGGFVTHSDAIDKRIKAYRQNILEEAKSSKTYYRYNFSLYSEVNLDEMLGLLHYNFAIEAYNQQKLQQSVHELSKAIELYYSPRIEEFSRIVLLSVTESDLNPSAKATCIGQIRSLRKRQFVVTASTN